MDFLDAKLPEKDPEGRIRVLVPKFKEMIHALTDLSLQFALLEVGDTRDAVSKIKKQLADVRVDLLKWMKYLKSLKVKENIKFQTEVPYVYKRDLGPFYPGDTFGKIVSSLQCFIL